MKRTTTQAKITAADRNTLRRRIRRLYAALNRAEWGRCFEMLDPHLSLEGRVQRSVYAKQLEEFRNRYGSISPQWMRLQIVPEGAARQGDPRPFALVIVLWQDAHGEFHLFRERWVKHQGRWYTRVAGLIGHKGGLANEGQDRA